MRSPLALLVLLLAACSDAAQEASETLVVSATTGPEETLAGPDGAAIGLGDPHPLALDRTCDAQADYDALVALYDTDGDGALSADEADAVATAYGAGDGHRGHHGRHGHRLALLKLIYDVDQDGAFSTEELTTLFDDFTARCEALQAQLLERFDADGDGVLSDEELATADATLTAEAEAAHGDRPHHDDVDGDTGDADGPHDDDRHGGHGEGGRGGHGGGHHEDGAHDDAHDDGLFDFGDPEVPPELAAWDTNADGAWDEAELDALREEFRARIRNGERLLPHPHDDDATGTDTGTGSGTDTGSDTGTAAGTGTDTGAGSSTDTGTSTATGR